MWPLAPSAEPPVSPGADSPVHRRLDGALDVGPGPGPGQLLHPILDCSGGPAWHWAPGTQLPCPLAHWRQRHRRWGLAQPLSLPTLLHFLFGFFSPPVFLPNPTLHSHSLSWISL